MPAKQAPAVAPVVAPAETALPVLAGRFHRPPSSSKQHAIVTVAIERRMIMVKSGAVFAGWLRFRPQRAAQPGITQDCLADHCSTIATIVPDVPRC